jgi:glycosyltransferase involved in cell wall biosynthesis
VETHVAALVAELEERGHRVEVITVFKDTPKTKLSVWKAMWQQRTFFFKADVVQVHDVWWSILPVLPFIFHKLYCTFHGWEGVYPVPLRFKLHRYCAALTVRKCIHIGAWISHFYWGKSDLVLYGGVDKKVAQSRTFPQSQRLQKSDGEKRLKLVFVGRLVAENLIKEYTQCVQLLLDRGYAVTVSWVGDGDQRKVAAQYGAVTGMVSQEQVVAAILDADYVMANSYLSMLMAQALGKPVLALYNHPLKQAYLETYPLQATLLCAASSTLLVGLLLSWNQTPDSDHARAVVQKKVFEQYTWAQVTDAYLRIWQS